ELRERPVHEGVMARQDLTEIAILVQDIAEEMGCLLAPPGVVPVGGGLARRIGRQFDAERLLAGEDKGLGREARAVARHAPREADAAPAVGRVDAAELAAARDGLSLVGSDIAA